MIGSDGAETFVFQVGNDTVQINGLDFDQLSDGTLLAL
jgi:hypothetical protein